MSTRPDVASIQYITGAVRCCIKYPEIYRCVLIDRVALPAGIEDHAEMWSIGVTLYHVATGQLPFQPLGGRNNRTTMSVVTSPTHLLTYLLTYYKL